MKSSSEDAEASDKTSAELISEGENRAPVLRVPKKVDANDGWFEFKVHAIDPDRDQRLTLDWLDRDDTVRVLIVEVDRGVWHISGQFVDDDARTGEWWIRVSDSGVPVLSDAAAVLLTRS